MQTPHSTRLLIMLLFATALLGCDKPTPEAQDSTKATHRETHTAELANPTEPEAHTPAWELTFSDEFDGPAGSAPDPAKWAHDIGGWGWGNEEPQTYTDGNANAFHDGEGHLVIEARREEHTGPDGITQQFTSARIKTQGVFSQTYGRVEARIKLPVGNGMWPAFWMLGDSITDVGWPACGEIDIMEYLGKEPGIVHGTLHGPGYSGAAGLQGSTGTEDPDFADEFHTFGIEWGPEEIRWYLDGEHYATKTPEDCRHHEWVFGVPHFILMNLACGGAWPGYPDETTRFPQHLTIDYVRAYRDANLVIDEAQIAANRAGRLERFAEARERETYRDRGPATIPGKVYAADYRPGGEGIGYHDADETNNGNMYRPDEGVDLGRTAGEPAPFAVGWTEPGEWLAYDIDVPQPGRYTLTARVTQNGPGAQFQLELDGEPLTEVIDCPDTVSWQAWTDLELGTIDLPAGRHVLKLVMISGDPVHNSAGNFTTLVFKALED